jgi:hypothetical protein
MRPRLRGREKKFFFGGPSGKRLEKEFGTPWIDTHTWYMLYLLRKEIRRLLFSK